MSSIYENKIKKILGGFIIILVYNNPKNEKW